MTDAGAECGARYTSVMVPKLIGAVMKTSTAPRLIFSLRGMYRRAKRAAVFWLNVLVICALLVTSWLWLAVAPERYLRIAGTALQVLGACTVAYDLLRSASKLGVTSITHALQEFLKNATRPRQTFNESVHESAAALDSVKLTSIGRVEKPTEPDTVAEVQRLREEHSKLAREIDEVKARVIEIEKESKERDDAVRAAMERTAGEHKSLIKELFTGYYTLLLTGAVWLILGIVTSGFSPEISSLIKR